MTSEEAESYILRLLQGDREALAPLMPYFRKILYPTVHTLVPPDAIPDCIQATIAYLLSKIAEEQVKFHSRPQFDRYLRLIARWQARELRRGKEVQLPESADGTPWEPVAPTSAPPDQAVTMARLLDQLLDASLASDSPDEKARATLEKLAFQSYYVDRLTVEEIANRLQRYAGATQITFTVSPKQVNNWLSGGRILKKIVSYVLSHRSEGVCATICNILTDSGMTERDWDMFWVDMRQGKRGPSEGALKIVKAIQVDLHATRKKGA
jgi:DNA-directed RNA polymerase specialized sigma24 family protein